MIKKFKIFESQEKELKHKVAVAFDLIYTFGDYVYVDQNKNNCKFKSKNSDSLEPYGVIKHGNAKLYDRLWDYQAEFYNFNKDRFEWNYIMKEAIIRKLTPEEIDDYKAKKNAEKYNL